MADICKGCVYYRSLSENSPNLQPYCNYLLDTGEPRGCPAKNCNKKISMEEYMKRLTQEQKQEIIRMRIEGNVPVKTIAEKFHVSKSSIFNIVSEWKKHGESAMSEEEIKNELHEQTISEAADDDYVCYEVTGDMDIEAYMADRNVKEPAPAATEASSKQENCVEVPNDIIPPKAQIVKHVIPDAVKEACRVRLDYLKDLIAEEQAVIDNWNAEMKEIIEFLEENKEGYADEV